ncbi:DUF6233 domain-containing protein [Streptomyces variabilis]
MVELGIGARRPPLQVHADDCYMPGTRHRPVDCDETLRLPASGLGDQGVGIHRSGTAAPPDQVFKPPQRDASRAGASTETAVGLVPEREALDPLHHLVGHDPASAGMVPSAGHPPAIRRTAPRTREEGPQRGTEEGRRSRRRPHRHRRPGRPRRSVTARSPRPQR